MTPDLTTFDGARAIVRDKLHGMAKGLLEKTGGVEPSALVIATELYGKRLPTPMAIMIALETNGFDEPTKDGFAIVVRRAVQTTRALGVIFMSEAWLSTYSDNGKVFQEYPQPNEDPARREVVIFSMEHKRRSAVCMAEIVRAKGCVTLGPLEEWETSEQCGRFMNFMGRHQAEA
jgi:hypothetical protein